MIKVFCKRLQKGLCLLLTVVLICTVFTACGEKTDVQLIKQRINIFSTACRNEDTDIVFNCLDEHLRNAIKGRLSDDANIDMSDIFGLLSVSAGYFSDLEISSTSMFNDTCATVTAESNFTEPPTEIEFYLVYERDDWYISNISYKQ